MLQPAMFPFNNEELLANSLAMRPLRNMGHLLRAFPCGIFILSRYHRVYPFIPKRFLIPL